MRKSYGIYIGRFQPLHIGHEHVIREALEKVDTLIVIIGSAFQAPTPVNPFTFAERKFLITEVFKHEVATGRMIVLPLRDYTPDSRWASELRTTVNEAILDHLNNGGVHLHGLNDAKISLTGYGKDSSSYYLKMFPEWDSIQLTTQHGTINASDIRHDYLRRLPRMPDYAVSPIVLEWLKSFSLTQRFKDTIAWKDSLVSDKAAYGEGPFLAADVLIQHRGKILLITRGKAAGRGTLAMPGGFVEKGETFYEAALRELAEETGLSIDQLYDFFVGHLIADALNRSLRGRIISVVHHFFIPDHVEIPKAIGGDDASHADWYDPEMLESERFYEDHYSLIRKLINLED